MRTGAPSRSAAVGERTIVVVYFSSGNPCAASSGSTASLPAGRLCLVRDSSRAVVAPIAPAPHRWAAASGEHLGGGLRSEGMVDPSVEGLSIHARVDASPFGVRER